MSVFTDVPLAQKLEGSLLKTYKRDDHTNKMFLAYKEPHGLFFQDMGFTVYEHTFWDSAWLCLDPSMLLDVVEQAPHGCIFVIGNIGNCKLTQGQWTQLMVLMKSKQIFPFFLALAPNPEEVISTQSRAQREAAGAQRSLRGPRARSQLYRLRLAENQELQNCVPSEQIVLCAEGKACSPWGW
ncbi:putative aspartate aminotransferase, cytoplasmic 2 [Mesoplodon densirostris]|uniref:putative aspartate aminotransferase, cytoplasmic 2 n=1 Tax=Mesoplodon densirostris TaxID=48708 RepID=UPI0028DC6CF8|nr:putative aspartate aminotransferase, cytoplasmic 2 [Mesoplodon densirostris]